jgi:hypothetical protein
MTTGDRVFAVGVTWQAGAAELPAWWIDPQNSSGRASDQNTGTSSTAPLLTLDEWSRRLGAQPGRLFAAPTAARPLLTPSNTGRGCRRLHAGT